MSDYHFHILTFIFHIYYENVGDMGRGMDEQEVFSYKTLLQCSVIQNNGSAFFPQTLSCSAEVLTGYGLVC